MPHSEHFTAEFHTLSEVIRRRRTSKDFDGTPVPKGMVEALLELAVWAPNHGLTQPWKFRVLFKPGVDRLVKYLKEELTEVEASAFEKPFEKISKAGAVIYITHAGHDNPMIHQENYGATCTAAQNILLAATAQHLQSFWSTSKMMTHAKTKEFLDLTIDENFVGAIWLGHGATPTPKPRKFAREMTLWIQ